MKNYLIEYTVKDYRGVVVKHGKYRVKNKRSDFEAKVTFEAFLKRKHPKFGNLIVHSCVEDNDILSFFNDIFKS